MQRNRSRAATLAFALALPVLLATACGSGTPEERVEATRARYEATLMGWVVRDLPGETAPEAVEAEFEENGPWDEETALTAEEVDPEPPPPVGTVPRDVTLNIQLWHNSPEMLPGITVDIAHADEHERVKDVYRGWFDTSRLMRAQHLQIDHVIPGLLVEPGDRFSVEVRHPVPAAERGEYREFQEI